MLRANLRKFIDHPTRAAFASQAYVVDECYLTREHTVEELERYCQYKLVWLWELGEQSVLEACH